MSRWQNPAGPGVAQRVASSSHVPRALQLPGAGRGAGPAQETEKGLFSPQLVRWLFSGHARASKHTTTALVFSAAARPALWGKLETIFNTLFFTSLRMNN